MAFQIDICITEQNLEIILALFANSEYYLRMILKPQDILVLLKLIVLDKPNFTYNDIADSLSMSSSEVHAGIKRTTASHLFDANLKVPNKKALEEFLVHGIKYCFTPERGEITRGLPTSYAASPIQEHIIQQDEYPPVWPHPEGKVRGYSFSPLYRTAPEAAVKDERLYRLLVVVDALRDSRSRERDIAVKELKNMLF
jgi:hypothetical protein